MRPVLFARGAAVLLARAAGWPLDPHAHAGPRPGDRHVDERRVVAVEPPGLPLADGPFRRVADAVLAYRVFPEWVLRGEVARVPLRVGDTFGNRFPVLPGLEVFFAGRVKAVIDEPARAGFTLRTVAGHPATGEETFEVVKDAVTGEVTARITSWSRVAAWCLWPVEPLFRLGQTWAVRAALDHLAAVAANGRAPVNTPAR